MRKLGWTTEWKKGQPGVPEAPPNWPDAPKTCATTVLSTQQIVALGGTGYTGNRSPRKRLSTSSVILSAHRTASALALILAGILAPLSNCARFLAARKGVVVWAYVRVRQISCPHCGGFMLDRNARMFRVMSRSGKRSGELVLLMAVSASNPTPAVHPKVKNEWCFALLRLRIRKV